MPSATRCSTGSAARPDRTAGWRGRSETEDRFHQRRLTRAVGAKQGHDLAGRDGEVAGVERTLMLARRGSSPAPGDRLVLRPAFRRRSLCRRRGRPAGRTSWSAARRRDRPGGYRDPAQATELTGEQVALAVGHAGRRLVEQQEGRARRERPREAGAAAFALDRRLEGAADPRRAIACAGRRSRCVVSSVMVPASAAPAR